MCSCQKRTKHPNSSKICEHCSPNREPFRWNAKWLVCRHHFCAGSKIQKKSKQVIWCGPIGCVPTRYVVTENVTRNESHFLRRWRVRIDGQSRRSNVAGYLYMRSGQLHGTRVFKFKGARRGKGKSRGFTETGRQHASQWTASNIHRRIEKFKNKTWRCVHTRMSR